MYLLYTNNFDGFCIVSSDSDFTRLACRIKEAGLLVYGFGEKKTPERFQKACDKFTYTENLEEDQIYELLHVTSTEEARIAKDVQSIQEKSNFKLIENQELIRLVKNAHKAINDEDGWANLRTLGAQLNKLSPSFDSKNLGCKKLGELICAIDIFEVKETPQENNPTVKALYIKLKN